MDLKGLSWFGNFCQKFEAMCLELEESVCEDTVKFVENQVQTVGASVKKFCSDVVHDMVHPTSLDSVKVVAGDFSLNPYSCDGVRKKPKVNSKKDFPRIEKQSIDDSKVITGKYKDHISSPSRLRNKNHFPPAPSGDSVKKGHPKMLVEQMRQGTYQVSAVETKVHIRKDEHPLSMATRDVASVMQDFTGSTPWSELTGSNEVASDQIANTARPTSMEVTKHESSGREENINSEDIEEKLSRMDASVDLCTSDSMLFVNSFCEREIKSCDTSFTDNGLTGFIDSCINSGLVSQMGSSIDQSMPYTQAAAEEVHTGVSDTNLMEDDIFEIGMETIDKFDRLDPDETCVFVDLDKNLDKNRVASETPGKNQSYKKKIHGAISSKRKAARKLEYRQLATQHGVIASGSNHKSAENVMPTVAADCNSKQLPTLDIYESEWELL